METNGILKETDGIHRSPLMELKENFEEKRWTPLLGIFLRPQLFLSFYGALASQEANQDPIDLAFITAAKQKNLTDNSFIVVSKIQRSYISSAHLQLLDNCPKHKAPKEHIKTKLKFHNHPITQHKNP